MKILTLAPIILIKTGMLSVYRDRSMLITDFFIATSIPFIIQAVLWTFVLSSTKEDQFTLSETYLYYACALSLNRLHNAYDLITRISRHINLGQLDCYYVKPLNYKHQNLFLFIGESSLYLVPPVIIAAYAAYTSGNIINSIVFVALLIPGQILCFQIGFLLAALTLVVKKPDFILSMHVLCFGVVGGTLLPPSYWPSYLQTVMTYNPFRVMIGGPAELLLKPSLALGMELIVLLFIWTALLSLLSTALFKSLQNQYNGAGG